MHELSLEKCLEALRPKDSPPIEMVPSANLNAPIEKRPNASKEKLNVSTENIDASSEISSSATMMGVSPMVTKVAPLEPNELLKEAPRVNQNALQNGPTDRNNSPLKEDAVNEKPVDQLDSEKSFAM